MYFLNEEYMVAHRYVFVETFHTLNKTNCNWTCQSDTLLGGAWPVIADILSAVSLNSGYVRLASC